MRTAAITRVTKETHIELTLDLEGGPSSIEIPSGFFTHMLEALARHADVALDLKAKGDVHVDLHHTIEDIGIVLGQAIKEALGDKKGITRYGLAKIPMDECLVEVSLDICNRPYFIIHGEESFAGKAGDIELDLVLEFFRALCFNAGITMHLTVYAAGGPHHLAEASFKAFARALKEAIRITGTEIPSTKHVL